MEPGDFESFFRAVLPRTVAAARRVTGDRAAAEDAAVEALARAHLRWPRVGALPWREGWVLKVAVNEALRQRARRPDPAPAATTRPVGGLDAATRSDLVAALRRLPRRQREAVTLRYLVDLSEAEVADNLGLHVGTVKTHLRRGLAAMRRQLGDDWEGGDDDGH